MSLTTAKLKPNATLTGIWSNTTLHVERPLGVGANGEVYLVRTPHGRAAMKTCERSADIALEWAVLDSMQRSSQTFPKPMFIDDAENDGRIYFYVMEWIAGEPLSVVLPTASEKLLIQIADQLCRGLSELHRMSQAFCDIKPENILAVIHPTVEVRFVDVGGVTAFGRSVRQFTPFYDRAFWNEGTRRADASYDITALALCLLFATLGPPNGELLRETPKARKNWLNKTLAKFPHSTYTGVFKNAIEGKYDSADRFLSELRQAHEAGEKATLKTHQTKVPRNTSKVKRKRTTAKRHTWDWTEWLMWISVSSSVVVLGIAWVDFLGWF